MIRRLPAAFTAAAAFILIASQSVFSQNTETMPRLEPELSAVFFAENTDTSDWRSLFALAYWAGGADDWTAAAKNLAPAVEELVIAVSEMDDRSKGEAVLQFMHDRFLKSYRVKQTRLDELLSEGSFNCVSSAVLYAILGTAAGLEVSGVNTVDHAFCSVAVDDEQIDVETTNPFGFDPGKKIEFQDDFGKTTGYSYVPPGNYRARTSIDVKGLFSLILQNRIADAESDGHYAEAVGLAADRWALAGGGSGREFEDLVIRMLNYGTMLSRAGREEAALAWAEKGIEAYGPHPKWEDFVDGVAKNLLIKLIRRDLFAEARRNFEYYKPRLTDEASASLNFMISDAELFAAFETAKAGGSDSAFFAVLERIRSYGSVSRERMREIELSLRLYRIDQIAKSEGWSAAYDAAEKAIDEMGSEPQLEKASRIYLSNQKAELYNEAVDAFNKRLFKQAQLLAEKALTQFPDEAVFHTLLRQIESVFQTQ